MRLIGLSLGVSAPGASPFLDIGELLQGAGWQDWPDHVQHVVDGDLQECGVHRVPFNRGWGVGGAGA